MAPTSNRLSTRVDGLGGRRRGPRRRNLHVDNGRWWQYLTELSAVIASVSEAIQAKICSCGLVWIASLALAMTSASSKTLDAFYRRLLPDTILAVGSSVPV
jgi:hypothetical protein